VFGGSCRSAPLLGELDQIHRAARHRRERGINERAGHAPRRENPQRRGTGLAQPSGGPDGDAEPLRGFLEGEEVLRVCVGCGACAGWLVCHASTVKGPPDGRQ